MAKEPFDRILGRSKLAAKTVDTQNRDSDWLSTDSPALPRNPDIEVEQARRVRQGRYNFAFDRNGMRGHFLVEGLAERDRVTGSFRLRGLGRSATVEPEVDWRVAVAEPPSWNGRRRLTIR